MADEIIDLRDRIEKMRIEIENEATEQISVDAPLEVHQKTSNSNISLSMENKNSFPNQNFEVKNDSNNFDNIKEKDRNTFTKNETFPAVSLSVKNPVSSKVLILLVTLQILSNIGILYFLYLGME
jgi:phosphate uptake regulator